tara:strand:- start:1236 stop:1586 length:351 start_codon:yes stop_codon:yes gene_type:complete
MMSDKFEVKMVGTEFPAYTSRDGKSGRQKKYFTNSTVSLLMANIGKVFLIHEEHNTGGGKRTTNKANSIRTSCVYYMKQFDELYPECELKYAVRQNANEKGGTVRLYAKVVRRDNA